MNTTEKVFYDNVSKYLDNSKKIIIAFSGGCDSLCLLALACKTLNPNNIIAVYVNHNLRPEEELEAELELNNKNCSLLGVQMCCVTLSKGQVKELSVKRGGGLEEAARILRYQALEELRLKENAYCIMTAHHRQDQLETIAMRLENGSPFTSLKGIASYDEKRHLLRPLLTFNKQELEDYLNINGLKWSTDSTNVDVNFTRNKMRNNVLPELAKVCPNYDKILLSLHEQALKVQEPRLEIQGNSIILSAFENLDTIQKTLLLYKLWDKVFVDKELSETFVSRTLEAIAKKKDCFVGASNAVFSLYRGYLYLTKVEEDPEYFNFEVQIEPDKENTVAMLDGSVFKSGKTVVAKDEKLALRMDSNCFKGKVVLRYAKEGDCIYLKGGKKMVRRLLQDMKIPTFLRSKVPVLVDEEGLCAVFGSLYGGKDRICVKFRSSIAANEFPIYIVSKG